MYDEVEQADYVLVVCTETYARRFRGHEEAGVGLGARWEGAIITNFLYVEQDDSTKFIPVVVDGDDRKHIMAPLSLTSFHVIGRPGSRNLEPLVAQLRGQPLVEPALLLGEISRQAEERSPAWDVLEGADNRQLSETVSLLENLIGPPSGAETSEEAAYFLGRLLEADGQLAAAINAYYRSSEYHGRYWTESIAGVERVNTQLQRHFGPGSAVEAAMAWMAAVMRGNMDLAWQLTQRNLRLSLVQAWIIANEGRSEVSRYDREELAAALSALNPRHRLRRAFFRTQLREFQYTFQGYNAATWGAAERPRRYGVEYELVIFMDTGGEELRWQPGEQRPAITLILKREITEWKVAGFQSLLIPGWPPTEAPLPGQEHGRPFADQ